MEVEKYDTIAYSRGVGCSLGLNRHGLLGPGGIEDEASVAAEAAFMPTCPPTNVPCVCISFFHLSHIYVRGNHPTSKMFGSNCHLDHLLSNVARRNY